MPWATGNAWAPCIEEKFSDGKWHYYFYFSGQNPSYGKKTLGVAVSESPTGPFRASSKPLFTSSAAGQMIDSDVFTDPLTGQSYLPENNRFLIHGGDAELRGLQFAGEDAGRVLDAEEAGGAGGGRILRDGSLQAEDEVIGGHGRGEILDEVLSEGVLRGRFGAVRVGHVPL